VAQQEAVEECVQLLARRQLVGRADEAQQRHAHARRAVVEGALVQDGQQRVQNA
jgi:hypothetical protein